MDLFLDPSVRSLDVDAHRRRNYRVIIRVDPEDVIDEVQNNNDLITEVNVSAGVKVSAVGPDLRLTCPPKPRPHGTSHSLPSLIGTNASLSAGAPIRIGDGFAPGWYVGLTLANFTLEGRGEDFVTVTAVTKHALRQARIEFPSQDSMSTTVWVTPTIRPFHRCPSPVHPRLQRSLCIR